MAYIYAYEPDDIECTSIGLVGALFDIGAIFELNAGEFGELTFEHPIDPYGKWRVLQKDYVLKTKVPVRLVPEVDDCTYVESVDVYKVSQAATKYQRYVYYASTSAKDPTQTVTRNKKKYEKTKHKKLLKANTKVTVVSDPRPGDNSYRYKVRVGSGKNRVTGYMEKAGLTLVQQQVPVTQDQTGLEADSPSYAVQPQLFRIYEVDTNTAAGDISTIAVRARRLPYDMLGNLTTYKATTNVSCQQVCSGVLENTLYKHPFTIYSDIGDKHVGIDLRDMNPIAALLDPDDGVLSHWGGEVVCDDYDIYLLRHAGMDRGVTIRHGKNLTGVNCVLDSSNVATAIRPVGETAAGAPLYLDGHVVNGRYGYNYDSEHHTCANYLPEKNGVPLYKWAVDDDGTVLTSVITRNIDYDGYATPKAASLTVTDAKITKTTKTTDPSETSVLTKAQARVMLAQAAVEQFDAGCDLPDITMDVNFIMLGDTQEYAQYRHLESLFVYDTVHIFHPKVGVAASIQLTSMKWLIRAERVAEATFGALSNSVASIPGWQISGLSGSKIIPGSVNSAQLAPNAVAYDHIQAKTINAEHIQSRSITTNEIAANTIEAINIHAGAITAEKLAAEAINAQLLTAFNAIIHNIDAEHVDATTLNAAMAYIASLEAGYAAFTRAQVTHLVANALNLEFGTLDEVFITNLSVAFAQIVDATIGNLCLKASDGVYYMIDVATDGTVTATAKDPQPTSAEIAAGVTEHGQHIVETSITALEMSTQTLHATYELVNKIDASRIDVDKLVARQAFINQLATHEIIGDSVIRMIAGQAQQASSIVSGGRLFRIQPEPPYSVNDMWIRDDENRLFICIKARGGGEDYDSTDWVVSNIHDATAKTIRDEVAAMIEVDTDGLHVKGAKIEDGEVVQTNNQVVVKPDGVDVKVGLETYSRFGARYAQFGAYQIREDHNSGLVFKLGNPLDDEETDGPHPEGE